METESIVAHLNIPCSNQRIAQVPLEKDDDVAVELIEDVNA